MFLGFVQQSDARDSTKYVKAEIKSKGAGGTPIGTIISWPVGTNPEGYEDGEWLECDGKPFNPVDYPELAALFPDNRTPNYQGMFLRGHGSQEINGTTYKSGELMEFQEYGVYIPKDQVNVRLSGLQNFYICCVTHSNGGHILANDGSNSNYVRNGYINGNLELDSPVTETRPTNKAIRYLIRALD